MVSNIDMSLDEIIRKNKKFAPKKKPRQIQRIGMGPVRICGSQNVKTTPYIICNRIDQIEDKELTSWGQKSRYQGTIFKI